MKVRLSLVSGPDHSVRVSLHASDVFPSRSDGRLQKTREPLGRQSPDIDAPQMSERQADLIGLGIAEVGISSMQRSNREVAGRWTSREQTQLDGRLRLEGRKLETETRQRGKSSQRRQHVVDRGARVFASIWRVSDVSVDGRISGSFGVSVSAHHSDCRLGVCCARRARDALFSGV